MNDHRSLRLALILLGRIKRNPESVYRAKLLHKLAQEPREESNELDELEFLSWTTDTYAIKENTDATRELMHVITLFMSSFGKKSSKIDPPEPAYRPGIKSNKKPSSSLATNKGNNQGATKPNASAGQKVYTLGEMDAEFFAAHNTKYGA